jgi:anti-sigma regulatory factor (Ser/Thr protein kinase)
MLECAIMDSATLVVTNRIPELRRMSQWLHERCTLAGVSEELFQRLDLCANEALANIMSYAYSDDAVHDIALTLDAAFDHVRLAIRDDGKPFNPLAMPEHTIPASLAEASIGGLGVHLIRRMMTSCTYERLAAHNVLTLDASANTLSRHA